MKCCAHAASRGAIPCSNTQIHLCENIIWYVRRTYLKYYKTNAHTHNKNSFYLHSAHIQVLINLVWSDWIWPTLCQHFGRCFHRRLRGRAPLSNWNMLLIKFIKYFAVAIKHARFRKRANRISRWNIQTNAITYRCINKDIPSINPQLRANFKCFFFLRYLRIYMMAHGHNQGLARLLDRTSATCICIRLANADYLYESAENAIHIRFINNRSEINEI